jgi:hypothetical protein
MARATIRQINDNTYSFGELSSQFHLETVCHELQEALVGIIGYRHEKPDCNAEIGQQVIHVCLLLLQFLLYHRYVGQRLLKLNKQIQGECSVFKTL